MHTMSRREFISYASASIAAATLGPLAGGLLADSGDRMRRPNILFVFADQLRACSLGCYGDEFVKTPHIDRLARDGMRFTHAYSATPVCTPYRAQLLTGRFGCTTGVTNNDMQLPPDEVTIAELLREQGYATGFIGKWHLDAGRKAPADDPRRQGFVPPANRQGFDYWAALECSHNYFNTYYFRDEPTPIRIDGYEPDVQTDLAIEYMRSNKDRPFMLMLAWGPPHNPYRAPESHNIYDPRDVPLRPNVPEQFQQLARSTIAQYNGLTTSLDDNIGRLTDALQQLGIADDTIVVFTSDHGDMLWSQGQRLKQRPWQESAHIPFILRWGRNVRAGQTDSLLLNSVDVMPTLMGLCGLPAPANVQGLDHSQVILGRSDTRPESILLSLPRRGGNTPAVGAWLAVRTHRWLYARHGQGDWLLYDTDSDPYQLNNLVDEPAMAGPKARLSALLDAWIARTGERILDVPAAPASARADG